MSERVIADARKLPFGNYDLTVYFGMGILALPLIYTLLVAPFGAYFPKFIIPSKNNITITSISILAMLFAGYALGHVIAFLSSYFIEKFVHRNYGYPSDLFVEQCENDNLKIEKRIYINNIFLSFPQFFMFLFHLPIAPIYCLVHKIGAIGYYSPKLPLSFKADIEKKMKKEKISVPVEFQTRWAKTIEHFVANNCPSGYTRMYNYLTIFGVMRSVSFLCIVYTWYYIGHGFIMVHKNDAGIFRHLHFRVPEDIALFFGWLRNVCIFLCHRNDDLCEVQSSFF